jgi:HAD superfamily hydrolase (TIGR01509 family)
MRRTRGTQPGRNPVPVFKAVVFDLDGTLIDSNWLHLRSWRIALENLGLDVPDIEIINRLGLKTADIARQVASRQDESTVVELAELKSRLFEEAWRRELKAREGALDTLEMIETEGLRTAVASSNTGASIVRTLQHFGMDKLLDAVVGIDEVQEGKPDPALVTVALKRLGVVAEKALYVGDSKYDIEAGRSAGTQTVLVLQPIAAQSNLTFQPDHRVKRLLELHGIIWPNQFKLQ